MRTDEQTETEINYLTAQLLALKEELTRLKQFLGLRY